MDAFYPITPSGRKLRRPNRAVVWALILLLSSGLALFPPKPAHAATGPWWSGDPPITQGYGCTSFSGEPPDSRCAPPTPYFHSGIDIGMSCGTPLYAGRDGTVISIGGPETYFGPYYITFRLADGHDVILGHDQPPPPGVSAGVQLTTGAPISFVGTYGNSTGCHLHFEVRPAGGGYGTSVDPTAWMSFGSSAQSAAAIIYGTTMQVFGPSYGPYTAIWNDSYPVAGGFNGWGGLTSLWEMTGQ